jgi:microcystin-dependent protein
MPYVGEIRMFAGNFAPVGWQLCLGQPVPISENETLFNLIGTTYGGDGQQTFALPDLQGRFPVHQGTGGGLQSRIIGEKAGVEEVTLTSQQIPIHTHGLLASTAGGTSPNPQGNVIGSPPAVTAFLRESPSSQMAASMVLPTGGSQPHQNMMPYLVINYIISEFGVFPHQ